MAICITIINIKMRKTKKKQTNSHHMHWQQTNACCCKVGGLEYSLQFTQQSVIEYICFFQHQLFWLRSKIRKIIRMNGGPPIHINICHLFILKSVKERLSTHSIPSIMRAIQTFEISKIMFRSHMLITNQ